LSRAPAPRPHRCPVQAAKTQGDLKASGWFVGQAMKATQGQADPQLVNEVLKKKLGG
jgi:aspartyl-tRNA(Asn)/glutamyl-tRNA(Gln) amidotransferase subunit B